MFLKNRRIQNKEHPKKKILRRLLSESKEHLPMMVAGYLLTMIASAMDAYFIFFFQFIFDKGLIQQDSNFLRILPWLIIGMFVIRSMTNIAAGVLTALSSTRLMNRMRSKLYHHMLYLPSEYYNKHNSSELTTVAWTRVQSFGGFLRDGLMASIREISAIISLFYVMLLINWRFCLCFLVVVCVGLTITKFFQSRVRGHLNSMNSQSVECNYLIKQSVVAYQTVRIFGVQSFLEKSFKSLLDKLIHYEVKLNFLQSIGTHITQQMLGIVIAFIISASVHLKMSPGDFVSVVMSIVMLLRPLRSLNTINNNMTQHLVVLESIFSLLDEPIEPSVSGDGLNKHAIDPDFKGHILIKNLSFKYSDALHPAISQLHLNIEPGQKVALVGRSGSGKSTLTHLLMGLYRVNPRQIWMDGKDLSSIDLRYLRNHISWVSQGLYLFDDTVANNIAFGDQFYDIERVKEAATLAFAHEFIEHMPKGFDTYIGEDGCMLSGGQKQRLAIARAFYHARPILILDEATSALDLVSERMIQRSLQVLMEGKTTIIVAHRLSTIQNADQIIVMQNGSVLASGRHEDLLSTCEHYQHLTKILKEDEH